jgi:hypothetical protein
MEPSPEHFSISRPKPTFKERVGKMLERIGKQHPLCGEVEPSPLERALEALANAERSNPESFPRARNLAEAGDHFKEAGDWRNAGGCYELAYRFYLDIYPVHNAHSVHRALIHTGLGYEQALRQAGEIAAAMGIHAQLEHVTGLEFDIPVTEPVVEDNPVSR